MKRITVLLGLWVFTVLFSCKKDDGDIAPSTVMVGKTTDTTALVIGIKALTDTAKGNPTPPSTGATATAPATPATAPTGTAPVKTNTGGIATTVSGPTTAQPVAGNAVTTSPATSAATTKPATTPTPSAGTATTTKTTTGGAATTTSGTTVTKPATGNAVTTSPSASATTTKPATTTTPSAGTTTTKTTTGGSTTTSATTATKPATTTTPSAGTTTTKTTTGSTTTSAGATTKPAAGTTTTTTTSGSTTTTKTGTTTAPSTGTTTTKATTGGTTPGTTTTTSKTSTGTSTTKTTTPAAPKTVQGQALAGVYGDGIHDDTKALQALLNKGNVTLTTGKTYKITGLSVPHAFNLNGATIAMSGTRGFALVLFASGASITNGNLVGSWNNTTAGNPNGVAGIAISADNVSVSYVNITSFAGYGISEGAYNNPSITHCTIQNTGYIGFYYDPESKSTTGGTFSYNTVDRSMLPAATVNEGAVCIRGSVSNAAIVTSGWTISNNVFKMPSKPANITAECVEVRNMINSTVTNNNSTAGSIGCSVVDCTGVTVSSNSFSGSSLEAIEFADSKSSTTQNNLIAGSLGAGILIDGSIGSNGIQLNGDKVSGTAQECIHAYKGTQNLTVSGCTLTSATSGTKGINLQGTSLVKILNSTLSGNGLGNIGVEIDNCPGNVTITGGTVTNFKSTVVSIYNSTKGLVTNNISMSGVSVTGTPKGLVSILANGGLLGTNISVTL